MENKFKVRIIGILFEPKSRKILLGKNKGDKNFSFLEGSLRKDVELDIELKHVAKQKTGYKIHNLGAVYAENKDTTLNLYFLCEATEGKETLGENVEEIIWVKPSEVESKLKTKFPTRLKEYILNLE